MSFNKSISAVPPTEPDESEDVLLPATRIFVFEPGWTVTIKRGSDREFCHVMAPGQDYYHRLRECELYLQRADERICLACATRRGIINHEPKRLRNPIDPSLADACELTILDPSKGKLERG
jgi:sulfur relay (sulfurtransferase) complex TusBCD TusD component (DsrE family)